MSPPSCVHPPQQLTLERSLEQIKAAQPKAHVFHLLVVPRMMVVCRDALEQLGVLGSVEIHEYQLGLIPLEKDVLSLEAENVWKRISLVSTIACGDSWS